MTRSTTMLNKSDNPSVKNSTASGMSMYARAIAIYGCLIGMLISIFVLWGEPVAAGISSYVLLTFTISMLPVALILKQLIDEKNETKLSFKEYAKILLSSVYPSKAVVVLFAANFLWMIMWGFVTASLLFIHSH